MDAEAVRARLESDEDVELIRAQHEHAYRIGVTGVPFFIVEGKYAISGAQDPGVFHQVFDLMAREGSDAEADAGADAEADAAGA